MDLCLTEAEAAATVAVVAAVATVVVGSFRYSFSCCRGRAENE